MMGMCGLVAWSPATYARFSLTHSLTYEIRVVVGGPVPVRQAARAVHFDHLGGVDRMSTSEIVQKDHEDLIELHQRMKPEERLAAFFYHSQLIQQMHQAGMSYRSGSPPSSKQDGAEKR